MSTPLQIDLMFKGLDKLPADNWPGRGTLSNALNEIVIKKNPNKDKEDFSVRVEQNVVDNFAKAAIEMWHRAVHSFVISASVTEASPIWASVSGYYSSHYSMRAFAHLLGYFQLFKLRKIVRLEINGGKYTCYFEQKGGSDREHKFYWKKVRENSLFFNDSFFTFNEESRENNDLPSDVMHRNRANYWDLINICPNFQVLDKAYLRQRIKTLSGIALNVAPIPTANIFPDVYKVQLVAYHRMVRFRLFMDNVLKKPNRFWDKQRNPNWCAGFLDFQIQQPESLTIIKELRNEMFN